MNRSFQVFLASAFGAGIGALIALSLNPWFWWLGLLVGGIAGYLAYEWREVLAAVPRAWRHAATRDAVSQVAAGIWIIVRIVCFLGCWACVYCLGIMLLCGLDPMGVLENRKGLLLIVATLMLSLSIISIIATFSDPSPESEPRAFFSSTRRMLLWSPPVFLAYQLPRLTFRHGPAVIRFARAFAWKLFLLIHSEKRLICGMDAMVGAAIGYYAGSAFIGAIAGGVLGLANYELVTRRWLIPAGLLPVRVKSGPSSP